MKLPRRNFLHLAAGAAALPALPRIARAQAYPARPVRLMVGFPAGSTSDIYARLVGQWLSERLAQPFVVENRPGAGGNIGTAAVVNAPPDGYTLLMIASANAINATLYERLNFDFLRDIAPIAGPIANPYVMVVNPSFPAKTVLEFVAYAKANPGKINMGSAGVGSTLHLSGELFKLMTGVDMVHVPNRSGTQLTDLIGGQVQVVFNPLPSAIELIMAGKLRALAVSSASRWPTLPDVPTLNEFVPAMRRVAGMVSAFPRTHLSKLLTSLTKKRMQDLRTPTSKRDWPIWVQQQSQTPPTSSKRSLRGKLKNGAR
jgi:tripartite-type tricarboxylate transporter receptor subunit TctC